MSGQYVWKMQHLEETWQKVTESQVTLDTTTWSRSKISRFGIRKQQGAEDF